MSLLIRANLLNFLIIDFLQTNNYYKSLDMLQSFLEVGDRVKYSRLVLSIYFSLTVVILLMIRNVYSAVYNYHFLRIYWVLEHSLYNTHCLLSQHEWKCLSGSCVLCSLAQQAAQQALQIPCFFVKEIRCKGCGHITPQCRGKECVPVLYLPWKPGVGSHVFWLRKLDSFPSISQAHVIY